MRCHSMQALWGSAPLRHHVRCMLPLDQPPSLWTGAADGGVMLWRLPGPSVSSEKLEVWPVALLCGHTAEIAALQACSPNNPCEPFELCTSSSSNNSQSGINPLPECGRAVISVCIDGGLCTWDSLTGRCRRRRHLPPWVGRPFAVASLPGSPRYVCIACNGARAGPNEEGRKPSDSIAKSSDSEPRPTDSRFTTSSERAESRGSGLKGAVVVVDTATLSVLQVVYNGPLGIGAIKAMVVVPEVIIEGQLKFTVTISDSFGRLRVWSGISVEQKKSGRGSSHDNGLEHASGDPSGPFVSTSSVRKVPQAVSLSPDGGLVLLVFQSKWLVRSVIEDRIVAEAPHTSSSDSFEDLEESDVQFGPKELADSCMLAGGFFLGGFQVASGGNMTGDKRDIRACGQKFLVWDNQGAAEIYCLADSNNEIPCVESLSCLPPISHGHLSAVEFHFCQLDDLILRFESGDFDLGRGPVLEPKATLWFTRQAPSLSSKPSESVNSCDVHGKRRNGRESEEFSSNPVEAVLVGQAGLWRDGFGADSPMSLGSEMGTYKSGYSEEQVVRKDGGESSLASSLSNDKKSFFKSVHNSPVVVESDEFVTATMLLSGSSSVHSMLVHGYASGEIQLVELEDLGITIPCVGKENEGVAASVIQPLRSLCGHSGPILCLAEHSLPPSSDQQRAERVLLSGSMDSTVCVWNLMEGGKALAVLHHHVAPVWQLLLPPPGTQQPWSHCFLSVSEDSCVALSSLESLSVERMFPGHPGLPKTVLWDGVRGFIACLCPHPADQPSGLNEVHLWDLHSGARERILRGSPAHSMFAYFSSRIRKNADATSIFSGNATSASTLLAPTEDPVPRPRSSVLTVPQAPPPAETTSPGNVLTGPGSSPVMGILTSADGSHGEEPLGVIGSLEKFSVKVAQALGQGAKPPALKPVESLSSCTLGKSGLSSNPSVSTRVLFHKQQPIRGASPLPGVAALQFDLFALMAPDLGGTTNACEKEPQSSRASSEQTQDTAVLEAIAGLISEDRDVSNSKEEVATNGKKEHSQTGSWLGSVQGRLLRMSLSFLHLWGVDQDLDSVLLQELHVSQPQHIRIGLGLPGDRGGMTLFLPSQNVTLELWKTSPEFCALRSLTMVALAQRLLVLSRPAAVACSALAAFYSRSLAEKLPGTVSPSLEVYACFWQDPSEHVRMAARSLFHCAASRAVPPFLRLDIPAHKLLPPIETPAPICESNTTHTTSTKHSPDQQSSNGLQDTNTTDGITEWLQSSEGHNWTAIIGGTNQDARAARIIVGAALALWYPSLVRPELAPSVAPMLLNLVRGAHDRHSATAAEILAEGMESTWQPWIGVEIPQLIVDVFFLIECLSGGGALRSTLAQPSRVTPSLAMAPAIAMAIRESLTGNLLPSLAMADVPGFLNVVHTQLTSSVPNSPVHLVALMALIRLIRSNPKSLIFYLGQVTALVMQTMDTGNSVLRKQCMQTAMGAVREMVRVFPMVGLHRGTTSSNAKLAVGDAVGDVHSLAIHVYDLHSATKLKVLDASGPPGHPALLVSNKASTTAGGISALSFSPEGEGLVAFSQQGLIIRWWSLGAAWWERLSRSPVAVQCTKLVLVPPWAGFSPRSSSSSIMAFAYSTLEQSEDERRRWTEESSPRLAFHNVDLSFHLEWQPNRKVALLHHGQELGTFQL